MRIKIAMVAGVAGVAGVYRLCFKSRKGDTSHQLVSIFEFGQKLTLSDVGDVMFVGKKRNLEIRGLWELSRLLKDDA